MNEYLKIFILSIFYYLIYLFMTLQAIPFVYSLVSSSDYQMIAIKMHIGPIPIGYLLMLLFAAMTVWGMEAFKARKKKDE